MLSHFTEPTIEHQTQCRSTMYSRHTIEHQTQCRSLPCTHTHVMRCLVHKCNAMPLHISHATSTMNATCNNTNHISCQVSWIIIFNTYNLRPFSSICLSHIFQHASIQSTCDSFFMHYKHTSLQTSIIYAKITWYHLPIVA